jgi:hypothetical protein
LPNPTFVSCSLGGHLICDQVIVACSCGNSLVPAGGSGLFNHAWRHLVADPPAGSNALADKRFVGGAGSLVVVVVVVVVVVNSSQSL